MDVGLQPLDGNRQGVEHAAAVIDHQSVHVSNPRCGEPLLTFVAPELLPLHLESLVGQHRMDAVLERGPHAHERRPMPQQHAQVAHLLGRDPGLGQQLRAQQMGEHPGIHLVVLQPGRGDRLAGAGVHQVRLQFALLEQVRQPPPAVSRLERHRRARLQVFEDVEHRIGAVVNVAVQQLLAVAVDQRHLAPLAMHIDSGVNHLWASSLSSMLLVSRGAYEAP